LLGHIGPPPAPTGLHHVKAPNTSKHIVNNIIHARKMSLSRQPRNAAAIGCVLPVVKAMGAHMMPWLANRDSVAPVQ
jgi:hypothetical protein